MKSSVVAYRKLSEHDDWRWDGEYLCFEPQHNKRYVYKTIGDILTFSQYGISIDMNEEGNGYKIYRMNEISNMFCDRAINKHADISKEQVKKFKLKNNDVLFNRTNSQEFVGRTGIFKKFSDEEIVFASYLIRVRLDKDEVLPEYLTTFLNTKYGVQDAKRRARISINQSNINAEELKRVKIPIIPKVIQEQIRNIFDKSFSLVNQSEFLYSQAEQVLLSELNLLNWKPKRRLSFVKSYSETQSASRIDAEYFQPMYDEIINCSKDKVKIFSADDVFNFRRGDFIDTKYYSTEKTNRAYIRIKELSNIGSINEAQVIYVSDDFKDGSKNTLKEFDIVMAIIGDTIGKSNLVLKEHEGSYFSNNTGRFRLRPDSKIEFDFFYLETLFHSLYIQSQVQKAKAQTGQPKIADSEIKKILIPCIDLTKQKEIGGNVQKALNSNRLSKQLLDIAKRSVEVAIEKDEKHAQKWISGGLEKLNIKL